MKYIFLLAFLMFSCSNPEEDLSLQEDMNTLNASMEILLIDCKDPFCDNYDPISDILIKIYEDEQDQKDEINALAEGYTNLEGMLNFHTINTNIVYISTHYNNQILYSLESISPNTHSFHRIEL